MVVASLVLVSEWMMLVGNIVAVVPVPTCDTIKQVTVINGLAISNTIPIPADPMTQTLQFSLYLCYSLLVLMSRISVRNKHP